MPTGFRLPNDHLTRRLLESGAGREALLEFLCTDSLYTFKDDFDKDDLTAYWSIAHGEVGSVNESITDFHFVEDAISGFIEGDPGGTDNMDIRLFSRHALWSPARRCVVQASFEIASVSDLKFEFGFVNPIVHPNDPTLAGVVATKATPTASDDGVFAVAVLDTDDNADCDLVIQTGGSLAAADQTGPPTLTSPGPISIMVSMTEGGGVRYWINGTPAGFVFIAPFTQTPTFGQDNPESGDHAESVNMHLWFMVQNRASDVIHNTRLDYVQAWQERRAV